jgi:hypothetical protein
LISRDFPSNVVCSVSFNEFTFSLIRAQGDKPCFGAEIGEVDRLPEACSWIRSSDRRTLRRRLAAWPLIQRNTVFSAD